MGTKKLEPNIPSTMYLKFLNAEDNSPLSADITYSIKITDERGDSVVERNGQTDSIQPERLSGNNVAKKRYIRDSNLCGRPVTIEH